MTLFIRRPNMTMLQWGAATLAVLLLATAVGCSREPEVSMETPLTESVRVQLRHPSRWLRLFRTVRSPLHQRPYPARPARQPTLPIRL